MSGAQRPNFVIDSGAVSGAGARVGGCRWCAPARSAQGVYTLTFGASQGFDAVEGGIALTAKVSADIRFLSYLHTSDVIKTVTVVDEALAAQDVDFDFLAYYFPGGD